MKTKKARPEKRVTPPARSGRASGRASGATPVKIPPILYEGDEPATLPELRGSGQVQLMARDPYCIYAHWDLSAARQRQLNARSADHHLIVRVHGSGAPAFEAHVHPESRHWFLHVARANTEYAAELGYHRPDGRWVRISRSDPVRTPPDWRSGDVPVKVAMLGLGFRVQEREDQEAGRGKGERRRTDKEAGTVRRPMTPPRVSWLPIPPAGGAAGEEGMVAEAGAAMPAVLGSEFGELLPEEIWSVLRTQVEAPIITGHRLGISSPFGGGIKEELWLKSGQPLISSR
jgi:hypothetical protein